MGGRGTYGCGNDVAYTYETKEKIDGIKVLQPMDKRKSLKLPEESHSANTQYVLLSADGTFRQYREYNEAHQVILEVGYHPEPTLGEGNVLHVHIHEKPGIEFHKDETTVKRKLTRKEYAKYKKYLKGVNINEREYFN